MTKNKIIGAIVVIGLIGAVLFLIPKTQTGLVGAVSQCASGQSCLPSLELTGPHSGVTNALQVDAGTVLSTATTSIGASLLLTPSGSIAPSCIQFYATSTATKVKLSFDASTTPSGGVGYLSYSYGSCSN